MLDDKRLSEIRERAERATAGEWRYHPEDVVISAGSDELAPQGLYIAVQGADATDGDMYFIAHAREDVTDLLAEIARLTAENARLARELGGGETECASVFRGRCRLREQRPQDIQRRVSVGRIYGYMQPKGRVADADNGEVQRRGCGTG